MKASAETSRTPGMLDSGKAVDGWQYEGSTQGPQPAPEETPRRTREADPPAEDRGPIGAGWGARAHRGRQLVHWSVNHSVEYNFISNHRSLYFARLSYPCSYSPTHLPLRSRPV